MPSKEKARNRTKVQSLQLTELCCEAKAEARVEDVQFSQTFLGSQKPLTVNSFPWAKCSTFHLSLYPS